MSDNTFFPNSIGHKLKYFNIIGEKLFQSMGPIKDFGIKLIQNLNLTVMLVI